MKRYQIEIIPTSHSSIAERNKKSIFQRIAQSGAQIVGGDKHVIIEVSQSSANDLKASLRGKANLRETA